MTTGGELHRVFNVFDADPRTTHDFAVLDWIDGDGEIRLTEDYDTVFVEYSPPAPALLEVAADEINAEELPERFATLLAYAAAGHLLRADGKYDAGTEWIALAEAELNRVLTRHRAPSWQTKMVIR